MKALWKKKRGTLIMLLAALCVMIYAYASIQGVPGAFQHVMEAPAPEAPSETEAPINDGLRDMRYKAADVTSALEGACEHGSLYAVGQPASISTQKGESADARLLGVEESWLGLRQPVLLSGRLIYPDEFLYGERVAVLDEALAVALFKYAEPLGEEVVLGEQTYRIVGVMRGGRQVGNELDYSLLVPYRALEKSGLVLTALVYEAAPVQGACGWSAFQGAVGPLGEGTTVSLTKERMNAAMPLRLLGVACGMAVALYLIRLLNARFAKLIARYREKLMTQYAVRLLGWLSVRGVLLALGYFACALALAQLFVWLVEPVYTFPEWVPAILVEPKDIQAAFWNVWQSQAAVVERRTPELLRLRFFRELMGWVAGAAALLGASLWGAAKQDSLRNGE